MKALFNFKIFQSILIYSMDKHFILLICTAKKLFQHLLIFGYLFLLEDKCVHECGMNMWGCVLVVCIFWF